MEQRFYFSFFISFHLLFRAVSVFSQVTPGDINSDGVIDSLDITRGKQIALEQPPPATQQELAAGDMNRDGMITVQDLVFIRNTIAGINRPPVADAGVSPDSGMAGNDIQLDATRSYDLDDDALTYRWRQLHMNQYSTEYMTANKAVLNDSTSVTPTFNPEWPGNYRFELTVTDALGLVEKDTVDVLVSKEGVRQLDVKGITFVDLFGELGSPEFDITPSDPDSLAAVQSRAMEAAKRIKANFISIGPTAVYEQLSPLPVIRSAGQFSLDDEAEYAAIVKAAHDKSLMVLQHEGCSPGFDMSGAEMGAAEQNGSKEWWNSWFEQWTAYLLPRAQRAEKYGVEMYAVFYQIERTFQSPHFTEYEAAWRAVIDTIRSVYSGQIITQTYGSGEGFTFLDALDALLVGIYGQLYSTFGQLDDVKNPTMNEVKSLTHEFLMDKKNSFAGKVPVYCMFGAASADAQYLNDPPAPDEEVDYGEQIIYYEGFFEALEQEDWISGLFTTSWAWFDEFDYPGTYFDEEVTTNPRKKPAEDLIKLWFGIY